LIKESISNFVKMIKVERIENEFRFRIISGVSKINIKIGNCIDCQEKILPLLQGENYEYRDGDFIINQKNGTTTFSFTDHEGASIFDISLPTSECHTALNFWVNESIEHKKEEEYFYRNIEMNFYIIFGLIFIFFSF
jgi:hypothetical protein